MQYEAPALTVVGSVRELTLASVGGSPPWAGGGKPPWAGQPGGPNDGLS